MPIPRIAEPRRAEQSRSEEGERASGRGAQVFRQISIEVRANGAGIHAKWKSHPGRHTRRSECRQCPIRAMVQWLVADRSRCGGPRGRHYRGETGLCADSRRKLGDGTPVQLYPGMLGREPCIACTETPAGIGSLLTESCRFLPLARPPVDGTQLDCSVGKKFRRESAKRLRPIHRRRRPRRPPPQAVGAVTAFERDDRSTTTRAFRIAFRARQVTERSVAGERSTPSRPGPCGLTLCAPAVTPSPVNR